MSRISVKGILIGGVTDVVSSIVFGSIAAVTLIVLFSLLRLPQTQIQWEIAEASHQRGLLWNVQLAVGLGCSVLGGFVAAWLARHDELLNGILLSFLCVSLGLIEMAIGKGWHPVYVQSLLLAASPLLSLLGGFLRRSLKSLRMQEG